MPCRHGNSALITKGCRKWLANLTANWGYAPPVSAIA
jgi:hypothetical protein